MINPFFILLILLPFSFGQCGEEGKGSSQLSLENLRWNVPADAWDYYQGYVDKGRFFRIISEYGNEFFIKNNITDIKVYETPDLSGAPLAIHPGDILKEKKNICSLPSKSGSYSVDDIYICQSSCRKLNKDEAKPKDGEILKGNKDPLYFSRYLGILNKEFEHCEVKIDAFVKYYTADKGPDNQSFFDGLEAFFAANAIVGTAYYFRTNDTDFNKGHVEISVGDKKYYIDARDCKKDPKFCKFVEIKETEYEKDLARLKAHQAKKDIPILNVLISELKPCVQKKDLECIKQYFVTPTSHNYLVEKHKYIYPTVTLDDDFLKELNACLDYDKLLPHLYGTRGINKACMFLKRGDYSIREDANITDQKKRKKTFLIGVDYPEAFRIRDDWESIFYVKEKNE